MKEPKVSFVICTFNCKDYPERCIKSIKKQDYPKNKIEILVVDSYSNDGTIEMVKKYGCKLILTKIRGYMEGKGMPKSIGCSKATGDIIVTIDSDNALVEKDWIKKTVYPLMIDKNIAFCISRMAVVKSDPLINQYLSFVGTDPFAIYCSIDPQITLGNIKLEDKGKYYQYKNDLKNYFIAGGYYLAFRKETLKKIGGYTRDVDVIYKLAKEGLSTLAIPKEAHMHHLMTKSTSEFLRKKIKWASYYFNNPSLVREFKWSGGLFGKFGKIRFSYEILYNLLFVPAFFVSLKMLIKYNNKAWLLHPFLSCFTTMSYILAFIKTKF